MASAIGNIINRKETGTGEGGVPLGLNTHGSTLYFFRNTTGKNLLHVRNYLLTIFYFFDLSDVPDAIVNILVNSLILSVTSSWDMIGKELAEKFRIKMQDISLKIDEGGISVTSKSPSGTDDNIQGITEYLVNQNRKGNQTMAEAYDEMLEEWDEESIDAESALLCIFMGATKCMTNMEAVVSTYNRRMKALVAAGTLTDAEVIPEGNISKIARALASSAPTRTLMSVFIVGISSADSNSRMSKIRTAAMYMAGTGLTMFYQILTVLIKGKSPLLMLPGPLSELPSFTSAIQTMSIAGPYGPYLRFIGSPDASILAAAKFPQLCSATIGFLKAINPTIWGNYSFQIPVQSLADQAERFGKSAKLTIGDDLMRELEIEPEEMDRMTASVNEFEERSKQEDRPEDIFRAPKYEDDASDIKSYTSRRSRM